MLTFIIAALGILLTIFFVVGIHELGHFITARFLNVKVLRFSFGFGKTLFRWFDRTGTEYVIAAIPLGGYVKMLDSQEDPVAQKELPYAFNYQPLWKRFCIVAAGPLFNLIFSFLIYWILFVVGTTSLVPFIGKITPHSIAADAGLEPKQEIIQINDQNTTNWMSIIIQLLNKAGDKGPLFVTVKEPKHAQSNTYQLNLATWHMNELKPDPLESLGITPLSPEMPAVINNVQSGSPAAKHFVKQDKIIAVNDQPIHSWDDLMKIISTHPDETMIFTVSRHGKIFNTAVSLGSKRNLFFHRYGFLGVSPLFVWPKELLRVEKYGPLNALSHAYHETAELVNLNLLIIGKMLSGKMSFKSLGGPITIFESAGDAINNGLTAFMNFLAFLSIAVGMINIVPIPGLDGGHVLFQAMELVTRKPVSLRLQLFCYRIGMALLITIFITAMVNDLLRLN